MQVVIWVEVRPDRGHWITQKNLTCESNSHQYTITIEIDLYNTIKVCLKAKHTTFHLGSTLEPYNAYINTIKECVNAKKTHQETIEIITKKYFPYEIISATMPYIILSNDTEDRLLRLKGPSSLHMPRFDQTHELEITPFFSLGSQLYHKASLENVGNPNIRATFQTARYYVFHNSETKTDSVWYKEEAHYKKLNSNIDLILHCIPLVRFGNQVYRIVPTGRTISFIVIRAISFVRAIKLVEIMVLAYMFYNKLLI
jgi:hypothetical protein